LLWAQPDEKKVIKILCHIYTLAQFAALTLPETMENDNLEQLHSNQAGEGGTALPSTSTDDEERSVHLNS